MLIALWACEAAAGATSATGEDAGCHYTHLGFPSDVSLAGNAIHGGVGSIFPAVTLSSRMVTEREKQTAGCPLSGACPHHRAEKSGTIWFTV